MAEEAAAQEAAIRRWVGGWVGGLAWVQSITGGYFRGSPLQHTHTHTHTETHTHSVPLASSTVHDVVRGYLLHYGFADTLAAFDSAAGLAGIEQPMRWALLAQPSHP